MLEQLILARHGETEWNVAGRAQGREDSPLTAAGLEQAGALGRRLASLGIEHIVASPLTRARRTADIAALAIGCTVSLDERLVERSFGELEGRAVADAMAEDERWIAVLRGTDPSAAANGGETLHQVAARILPAMEELRALPYRRVALLSHGHCLRAVLGALGNGSTANYHHGNCAYTPLSVEGSRFTFDRWNLSALELADA